ncbi:MAG: hypothetical protein EOO15_13490 [Chitinophagaceae bacterium]|nr:MAG: hypothetical protein EOO15_13490 [Chitinophagaceae bacterium]
MKQFIRTASLAAAAFLCAPKAEAQIKPFSFGVYAEAGFPTGSMANFSTAGYGAGVSVEARLPASLSATGSFGIMHFGGKSYPGAIDQTYAAINAYPLRVGAKYRFKVFYVGLETGAVFSSIPDPSDPAKDRTSGLLAPAIGVRFLNIDIRGKYESWLNASRQFWGLQASLKF